MYTSVLLETRETLKKVLNMKRSQNTEFLPRENIGQ